MAYINPQVQTALNAVTANPKVFAGAGGIGLDFKARMALRAAEFTSFPGTTNFELTATTNTNTAAIVAKALALSTR